MKMFWRSLALTVAVSLAAGWIGSEFGVRQTLHRFPGPVSGAIRYAVRLSEASGVHLDPDQARAMAALEARYEPRRLQLLAAVNAAHAEVSKTLIGQDDYGQQAHEAALRWEVANHQLQEHMSRYLMDVRRLLTPDQKRVLDRNLSKILQTGFS